MKSVLVIGAALATCLIAAPAMAASASQPPMNTFHTAFYNCDDNAAFLVSYDAARPKLATMTTSNNSQKHELKRTPASPGFQFSDGTVKFWSDGDKVTVEGAEIPLLNCKKKAN
jgi:membrane-bound inhibitor of C-type lysozyme